MANERIEELKTTDKNNEKWANEAINTRDEEISRLISENETLKD